MKQCSSQNCPSCVKHSNTATFAELGDDKFSKRMVPNVWDQPWSGDAVRYVEDNLKDAKFLELASIRGVAQSTGGFIRLEDKPAKYAIGGLSGCVAVVVASRAGLYISHHWEVGAYSPGHWKVGLQEIFQKKVLDEITHGAGDDMRALSAFIGENGPFSNEYNPAAFIIQRSETIHESDEYDAAYNKKNRQLADRVESITGIKPQIRRYSYALRSEVKQSIKGMILFQYDPDAFVCEEQQAQYTLWTESTLVHFDIWSPLENQAP